METPGTLRAPVGWFEWLLGALVIAALPAWSSGLDWAHQEPIPGYTSKTWTPYVVADRDRAVHAFGSRWRGSGDDELALIYSRWTLEGGWTAPESIMPPPYRRQAAVQGVILDRAGQIHLIFFGGDDLDARIYYARAPLWRAGWASSWSSPKIIGRAAITPRAAALASDERGTFVVVYGGRVGAVGLYAVSSRDGGDTWSDPALIAATGDDERRPWAPDLTIGDEGRAHVVWNVVDRRGHNVSGHYARLDLRTGGPDQAIEIDRAVGVENGMGLALPAISRHEDTLITVYNNGIPPSGVPPAHWFRYSSDGGVSWTPAARAFPRHVGRNGRIALVADSADVLHALFGQRIPLQGTDATHGLWHSEWVQDQWSEPEAVVSGPQRPYFDPYEVRAAVSQGNVLLVTWMTDPGLKDGGVWSSHARLPAPELPLEPVYSPFPAVIWSLVGLAAMAAVAVSARRIARVRSAPHARR